MAIKKKGTPVGHMDKNGKELFVGDYVRAESGKVYMINKYCNLFSSLTGNTKWANVGPLELITADEYTASINASAPAKLQITEAPKVNEDPASSDNLNTLQTIDILEDVKKQLDDIFEAQPDVTLSSVSDEDIIAELRKRGFQGTITRTVITSITL